jgi:putative sigma-54 modulation protein
MQMHLTGRNIEITPALKTFTADKMQRIERRFSTITTLHVTLQLENMFHIAEAAAHVNGADIHAKAKADDMYSAIDELVDKLTTQITKHKEKHAEYRQG